MQPFLIAVHVITCIVLVITVLLQQGKGAEVGAVFGSSEAIFGSAGPATLLSKITTACAIIFMLTSLSLTYLSIQNRGQSVMRNVQQVPVTPSVPGQMVPSAQGTGQKVKQAPASAEHSKKLNNESTKSSGEAPRKDQATAPVSSQANEPVKADTGNSDKH